MENKNKVNTPARKKGRPKKVVVDENKINDDDINKVLTNIDDSIDKNIEIKKSIIEENKKILDTSDTSDDELFKNKDEIIKEEPIKIKDKKIINGVKIKPSRKVINLDYGEIIKMNDIKIVAPKSNKVKKVKKQVISESESESEEEVIIKKPKKTKKVIVKKVEEQQQQQQQQDNPYLIQRF